MGSASTEYGYAVDGDDVIVSLGDGWLLFARENGAPQLCREALVGRSLWEYVAGATTRQLYEAMFRRVRDERRTLALPFRCDSPDLFRFMELAVEPGERGALQLTGRLLREQARPHFNLLDRLVTRSSEPLPICSVCLRVELFGTRWVSAEEAVERLDLFDSAQLPPLDYRVCPACVEAARGRRSDVPGASA